MEISSILFFVFAAMTALPIIYLLVTNDIIRAAFALAISLLGVAALYVLLHAELMAVVQILIYVGGIIVLLIFGVMLTKRIGDEGVFTTHRSVILGGLIGLGMFVLLVQLVPNDQVREIAASEDQVRSIGFLFLTDYLLAFEVIAYLLLVALVGSAYLAKKSGSI